MQTAEDLYRASGLLEHFVVDERMECPQCRSWRPLFCIAHHDGLGGLACDHCRTDADRVHDPIHLRPDIDLDAVRDERNRRLAASDWIEFPSARMRNDPVFVAAMDAYRSRLFEVVKEAEKGVSPAWPVLPSTPAD